VTWTDDFGFHFRGVDSFPGSASLAANPMGGVGAAAMMAGVMLPARAKAMESANRVKSASNLRQIGMGCIMYANDNGGRLPDDLGRLVTKQYLPTSVLIGATGHAARPPAGVEPQPSAAWVNEHSDFVYVGAGKDMKQMGPDKILAHEKMEIAAREHGMNILFGDGHVEWFNLPEAQRLLKENPE
jgi:prepilin-type processing-associated H-X9-DG protein